MSHLVTLIMVMLILSQANSFYVGGEVYSNGLKRGGSVLQTATSRSMARSPSPHSSSPLRAASSDSVQSRNPVNPFEELYIESKAPLVAENKFNLVFENNFKFKFLKSSLVFGIITACYTAYRALSKTGLPMNMKATKVSMIHTIALSLLSSSCCALQLFLNFFFVGCAGLNSLLGPLRPQMFVLSLIAHSYMWSLVSSKAQFTRALISSSLSAMLTFLPEMLFIHAEWLHSRKVRNAEKLKQSEQSTTDFTRYTLRVSGIGCIACVSQIQSIIDQCSSVVNYSVSLEKGIVCLTMFKSSKDSIRKKTLDELIFLFSQSGYPSSLLNEASVG